MKHWYIVVAALLLPGSTSAQVVPDRYIVELAGEPAAAAAAGKVTERRAAIAGRRAAVLAQQRQFAAAIEAEQAEVLGSVDTIANALFVRAQGSGIERLRQMPGVMRVHPVRMYQLAIDRAVYVTRIADAWAQLGGSHLAGAGVKVGIVDTGIDISHPGFQDPELRAPEGYPRVNRESDIAHTNGKVIVARDYQSAGGSARDTIGHGTSVAMVAAGNTNAGPYGVITGVAARAWLGSYKVFPDEEDQGAPNDAILKALDDAVKDGMDVINLSLGTTIAERPELDPLVAAIDRAASAGIVVVVAAGNEGPDLNTIASPATASTAVAVGNSGNDRVFTGQAVADDAAPMMAVPGESGRGQPMVSGILADVSTLDGDGLACSSLPLRSLQNRVALILRGTCVFEEKLANVQGAGAVAALVYTDAARPEPIPMGTGSARLPASMISYADGAALKARLQGTPALRVTLDFSTRAFPVSPDRLSDSSSSGPSSDYAVKPDVLAVGTSIYTARPGGYSIANGTSLSAPVVSGAAALLKAARPGLTAEQYRSLLINSASSFSVNGAPSALNVQQGGAGLLNVQAAVNGTVAAYPPSIRFGTSGGTVDATRVLSFTNLAGETEGLALEAHPLGSSAVPELAQTYIELAPGATNQVRVRFTGSQLAPGAYQGFVIVRSTRTGRELRIPYWHGVPSDVPHVITQLSSVRSNARVSSRQQIVFRVTDAAGLPVSQEPSVTVSGGDGRVTAVTSIDDEVPGAWLASVRLGAEVGNNTFRIAVGELSREVVIPGN